MNYSIATKDVCKICLQKSENKTDLFSDNDKSKNILNKIKVCFQITLTYDKLKPCAICINCIKDLDNSDKFRLKCLTVDERFSSFYKHLQNNNYEEETMQMIDNSDHLESDLFLIEYPSANNDKNSIAKSENNNINANSKGFKCKLCDKILKTTTSLLKHNMSMHEKRKHSGMVTGYGAGRRYHCTTCAYSTPHSQTLVNHMRRHNGERPYNCQCGKTFTQASSLAAHQKTHSNATYFTCSLCGKQFKHAFSMKNHQRVHEIGNFSCNICHKTLKSKQSLSAHLRRHYNIYNYNCEDCGDTFVTSSELLNHRKIHSIHKTVECHLCGYKTRTKKNLIVHLKRHAGNRTYKCDICKVAFYTKGNLLRHRRVHTREKPFSCPACAQRYKYSPSLNKHMKMVHGVEYKWADFKWKENKIIKLVKCEEKSIV